MTYDSVKIQYHGFHPTEFTETYLDSIMQEILEEAPYDATLQASFARKDGCLKAVVQVHSGVGPFFAAAAGNDLREVSKKLLEQMRRKLGKWKSKKRSAVPLHHVQVKGLEA